MADNPLPQQINNAERDPSSPDQVEEVSSFPNFPLLTSNSLQSKFSKLFQQKELPKNLVCL